MRLTNECKAFVKGVRDAVLGLALVFGVVYANDHFEFPSFDFAASETNVETSNAVAKTATLKSPVDASARAMIPAAVATTENR